jgi:hypothetical protein
MKIQQPLVVVLFFLLFLNLSQAQIFQRSWVHDHGLKRYSRERRRLHWHQAPEVEDQRSRSHRRHDDGGRHGRKSDQSSDTMSRKGLKGHSQSKKRPPPIPHKGDSSKSNKNGKPMSHSSKSKKTDGRKSHASKSQGGSERPEAGMKTMESRKDDLRAPAEALVETKEN